MCRRTYLFHPSIEAFSGSFRCPLQFVRSEVNRVGTIHDMRDVVIEVSVELSECVLLWSREVVGEVDGWDMDSGLG